MVKVLNSIGPRANELGANLRALLREHGGQFASNAELARECKFKTTSGEKKTFDRLIKEPDYSFSYASLAKIADGFKVEPWMLLIPGFDPTNRAHVKWWQTNFEQWDQTPRRR